MLSVQRSIHRVSQCRRAGRHLCRLRLLFFLVIIEQFIFLFVKPFIFLVVEELIFLFIKPFIFLVIKHLFSLIIDQLLLIVLKQLLFYKKFFIV
jgi:hypothetical protein